MDKLLCELRAKLDEGKELVHKGVAFVKKQGGLYMDLYGRQLVDSAMAVIIGHLFLRQAQDAERKHVEAMGSLEEKRASLDRKVDELRTFEREYRTRLRSYLESHLRDLDSRGSAEPSSNTRQNQHVSA